MMLNGKLILSVAVLLVGQIILYFGCECFQKRMHNVLLPIDARIPFIEASVLVYVLWFPLIALFPLGLYGAAPLAFAQYMTAMAVEVLISVVCYLIYPTTFERPRPSDTWVGRLMTIVYSGSFRGVNCAPSLHCSSCYLIMLCALTCAGLPLWACALSVIVAAGIVVSTMTTKQHAVIDAVTAVPVALVCWLIGRAWPVMWLAAWIAG